MRGLGSLFTREHTRDLKWTVSDTEAGTSQTYTVVTPPAWMSGWNTFSGGMGVPGAWRASVLLSDLLGGIPWHAYRSYGGAPETKLDPTPPLLDQPSPPDTRMTSISSLALDLLWEGNAVAPIAARNGEGWPTAILPVSARDVHVKIDSGRRVYRVGQTDFDQDDILHIKGPCKPGELRGMGVLETHLSSLELSQAQTTQARKVANHGVPTGVITTTNEDITADELRDAKTAWMEAQMGGQVAALGPNTDFKPISWNPHDMQLVEARRYQLTDIELIFGLPVGWLGGMSSSRQYSNIEQDAINLIRFTLGGHLARFEQALSLLFPRGTIVRANLDSLLRADTLTRYQAHEIGIRAGFLTDDEAREYERRPPLTDAQREQFADRRPNNEEDGSGRTPQDRDE